MGVKDIVRERLQADDVESVDELKAMIGDIDRHRVREAEELLRKLVDFYNEHPDMGVKELLTVDTGLVEVEYALRETLYLLNKLRR